MVTKTKNLSTPLALPHSITRLEVEVFIGGSGCTWAGLGLGFLIYNMNGWTKTVVSKLVIHKNHQKRMPGRRRPDPFLSPP